MADKICITLKRSMIGRPEKFRRILRGMGLTKLNKTVFLENTPAVRGMIQKVAHMVEVGENKP